MGTMGTYVSAAIALSLLLRSAVCVKSLKPIPRHSVMDLSPEAFDSAHLNGLPVILTGTSICPAETTLENVGASCRGNADVQVLNGSDWAGLQVAGSMDIAEFIAGMGQADGPPRYLFDLDTERYCPSLLGKVVLPAHISTAFVSQWIDSWEDCALPPHFNFFIAEKSFSTSLHVDSINSAFVASMCTGQRRWRIITNSEYTKHAHEFPMDVEASYQSIPVGDGTLFANVMQPYDTWGGLETSRLEALDIEIYEGVIEPGELLYIPPGALHAAQSLDHSLMWASNDLPISAFKDVYQACRGVANNSQCEEFASRYSDDDLKTVFGNLRKHGAKVPRRDKPFFEAYRCKVPAVYDLIAMRMASLEESEGSGGSEL